MAVQQDSPSIDEIPSSNSSICTRDHSHSGDSEVDDGFVQVDQADISDEDINAKPRQRIYPATELQQWLKPTAYHGDGSEFHKHCLSHLAGTGRWLTESNAFQQWRDGSEHGLLWIKGIPGSGKSVVAAHLINELAGDQTPVLFFFFRQIIAANHEPFALVRDWLAQMLRHSRPLQRRLSAYIDEGRDLEAVSRADLLVDLRVALGNMPKLFCIVDALDEMDQNNDDFLRELAELASWQPAKIKVIVTSRPVVSLEQHLRTSNTLEIRLEQRLVDVDIAKYVQHCMSSTTLSSSDRDAICEAVPGRASGIFLYAKLAMDAVLEPDADVTSVLARLPLNLDDMYKDLLREHARRSAISNKIQLSILGWVTHANRPLRLLELAEITNIVHFEEGLRDLKRTKTLVRLACGPLLEVLPDETVSVVHHSLTEFLTKKFESTIPPFPNTRMAHPVLDYGQTHASLASACLEYLQSGCVDKIPVQSTKKSREYPIVLPNSRHNAVKLKHPFLEYASSYWCYHAQKAETSAAGLKALHSKLDTFLIPGNRFHAWLDLAWHQTDISGVTPLHVVSSFGLTNYTNSLVELDKGDLDVLDGNKNTAIALASAHGHTAVVQLLLTRGAQADIPDGIGLKPLHKAASNGHADVVALLLAHGVDPLTPKTRETGVRRCGNAPSSIGHTAVMYACQHGHFETVRAFLPFLKSKRDLHRALSWAAGAGRANVVSEVLKRPEIDVNSKEFGPTALVIASNTKNPDTIEALLKAGADPRVLSAMPTSHGRIVVAVSNSWRQSTKSSRGFTALHALCSESRHSQHVSNSIVDTARSLELLLSHGADIHQKDDNGQTALHRACNTSGFESNPVHLQVIRLLVEHGADANATDDQGTTPLHLCLRAGDEAMQVLIQHGNADINRSRPSDGKTPLLCMLSDFNTSNTLRFLQFRPDCNAVDLEGNGALHVALQQRNTNADIVKALLAAGTNPNLQNNKGETPLHVMAGHAHLIEALVAGGARLDLCDNLGQTALFKVLQERSSSRLNQNLPLFYTMVDQGASVNARDYKGRTVLHEAVKLRSPLLNHLWSTLSDPYSVDYEGNTLLHEAALARRSTTHEPDVEQLQTLVNLGISPDQANWRGQSCLHVLCSATIDGAATAKKQLLIEYFISIAKDIDSRDHAGRTSLHVAATISEYHVELLLRAGADHTIATLEGMTPLHLAARARQANIVGRLLACSADMPVNRYVDSQDRAGRTALHYACRSGRPESVALLLEHGANPNISDNSQHTPFEACVEYEIEHGLWQRHGGRTWAGMVLQAAGTGLEDECRPYWSQHGQANNIQHSAPTLNTQQDGTRLPEILDMLVAHGSEVTSGDSLGRTRLSIAMSSAMHAHHDYTLRCLLELRDRLGLDSFAKCREFDMYLSQTRSRAAAQAFEAWKKSPSPGAGNERLLKRLLAMREERLVEQMFNNGVDFLDPSHNGETHMHTLVNFGYAELLKKICTAEAAKQLDDVDWCREVAAGRNGRRSCTQGSIQPLLMTACARELPTMDILRWLVEDLRIDVNSHWTKQVYRNGYEMVVGETALHILAAGGHWWQVNQALPYLITHGADIEARNELGQTPLAVAIGSPTYSAGPYCRVAAELLMDAGANVNAIDDSGESCITKAAHNFDMLRLLLKHGAEVSASSLFAALEDKNLHFAQALLENGVDPNVTQKGAVHSRRTRRVNHVGDAEDIYPLYYAAIHLGEPKTCTAMLTMLLRHGADPYASFRTKIEHTKTDTDLEVHAGRQIASGCAGTLLEYKTVIHEILCNGGSLSPILELPKLDLECRDSLGRTLLLAAACRSMNPHRAESHGIADLRNTLPPLTDRVAAAQAPSKQCCTSVAQILLERGSDVYAVDNEGMSVLHHLAIRSACETVIEAVCKKVVAMTTDRLLNKIRNDGSTALLLALQKGHFPMAELLLQNGANVSIVNSKGDGVMHAVARSAVKTTPEAVQRLMNSLLDKGANIDQRNGRGETPLYVFVSVQGLTRDGDKGAKMVDYFVAQGADLFTRNANGESLLHAVTKRARKAEIFDRLNGINKHTLRSFEDLLERGLDPASEDNDQRTPLDIAVVNGHEAILKLFERKE